MNCLYLEHQGEYLPSLQKIFELFSYQIHLKIKNIDELLIESISDYDYVITTMTDDKLDCLKELFMNENNYQQRIKWFFLMDSADDELIKNVIDYFSVQNMFYLHKPMENFMNAFDEVLKGNLYVDPLFTRNVFDIIQDNSYSNQINKEHSYHITKIEYDIIVLLLNGKSQKEISKELYLTTSMVSQHLNRIRKKLNVDSNTQMVAKAILSGIIPKEEYLYLLSE